ncbi:MAG: hypothetical protein PHG36_09705, partial [Dehalococcoidia bacterium]|nr:hypothetical protein [Dehalococcoidia bacterium]
MSKSTDIGRQLERHRNETVQAVRAGRTEVVKRRLNAYTHFIQVVLNSLYDLNIKYTPEQVSKVSTLDWPILRYLEWNLYMIMESIFDTEQKELGAESIRLLVKILKLSSTNNDYLIFKRTLNFFPALLRIALESREKRFQHSVVETLIVDLTEFADSNFVFHLNDQKVESKRDQYLIYLQYILETIQAMLKQSVDSKSLKAFIYIGNAFDELSENISLEFYRKDSTDRSPLSPMIFNKSAWFDLGSWLCNLYKELIIPPSKTSLSQYSVTNETDMVQMINQAANRFNSISELSKTYVDKCESDPLANRLDDWIFDSMPPGKTFIIETSSLINLFFCIRGLSLLPIDIDSSSTNIPPNSTFKRNIDSIVNTVRDIQEYRYYWEKVIPPEALKGDRVENFISLIKDAAVRFERANEDRVIASSISEKLVDQFKKDVIESWQESAWLRKLISRFSDIQQRELSEPTTEYFGINASFPKEAFIEASELQYRGIGKQQGTSLGSSESSKILGIWSQNAMIEIMRGAYNESMSLLENAIKELRDRGFAASAIIILDNYHIVGFLIKHGELIPTGIPNFRQIG